MKSSDTRDRIDNELKRVQIQNHPNFESWYASLEPHARQVIDFILEEDVTAELIAFSQDAPDDEWEKFQFLRIIGGGNPDPVVIFALTNFTLEDVYDDVKEFGKLEE